MNMVITALMISITAGCWSVRRAVLSRRELHSITTSVAAAITILASIQLLIFGS